MSVAAVVLAAGGGTRFAGATHKLLAEFRGRPVVAWAIDHAVGAGLDEVIVVWGAIDLRPIAPEGVTLVRNRRWSEGQATSLACAVGAARDRGCEAIVVGLGDQPLIPAATWQAVAAAPGDLVTAVIGGQRTPPVRIGAALWSELPAAGDEGARALMRSRPDLVTEIACGGQALDIDTVEDLHQWS